MNDPLSVGSSPSGMKYVGYSVGVSVNSSASVGISRPSGIIYVGNSVPGRKSVSGNSSVSISVPGKTYVDDSGGVVGAISGDDVAFRRACKGKGTY